ncbi:MAG TPA: SRPBCC family protein, partial [Nevskia sp.]|nr:SRPBCC family protein [Nevskia sp.]
SGSAGIVWPERYAPANCPIHVRNELEMAVPAERVWAWLLRAPLWPGWYPNSKNVRFLEGRPPDLALGTRFRWTTFGVNIVSTVREFVPNQRIAWDATGFGLDVYHAWLIRPTTGGCHVLTEETQHGFAARAGKLLFPGRMYRFHQVWLERMAEKAAAGMPPGA